MNHIAICGTIVTKAGAHNFLKRVCKNLFADHLTLEASFVMTEIERRLIEANFLTPIEIEAIEIEALKEREEA